jgi:hypothetical protein
LKSASSNREPQLGFLDSKWLELARCRNGTLRIVIPHLLPFRRRSMPRETGDAVLENEGRNKLTPRVAAAWEAADGGPTLTPVSRAGAHTGWLDDVKRIRRHPTIRHAALPRRLRAADRGRRRATGITDQPTPNRHWINFRGRLSRIPVPFATAHTRSAGRPQMNRGIGPSCGVTRSERSSQTWST